VNFIIRATGPFLSKKYTRALAGCCAVALLPLAAAQTAALPPITAMPKSVPYHWASVVIRGGGFVSGIVFSTTQTGLVYARTDVGGAYRSDDAGNHWVALEDQFGRADSKFLGIESLALDPSDSNKLYLAAGMYSADWSGTATMLRSNDRGKTFEQTPVPFKMGGNDDGRGCGERLAVDPNLGSVLFFGSRKAGLWKSTDSGVTWAHVDSFPVAAKVTGVGANTGITFVLFDPASGAKGSATKTLYAGVAQAGASLYRSNDAGATWQIVAGAPAGLFPNHGEFGDRALYFTFVDNVGPNGIENGALMKLLPDGKWKDISPIQPGTPGQGKFGFGALAIDAEHPETVMVGTIDRWWPSDAVFRSTDGGKHWKDVFANAQFKATTTPWVYWHKETTGGHGWISSIAIDPFNPNKVMYTTGEGIWGSADVTLADSGKPTQWGFPDEGIEETVPLAVVSPPQGAHLLSAVGDISGFRHEDVNKSPEAGFFIDPQLSTNHSLDFAGLDPTLVVRVGYGDGKVWRGAFSTDDGTTWTPFASEPASSTRGGGYVALSADGKTIVWSPDKGAPYWSADRGNHWQACAGLEDNMRVVSDRVDPKRFYSFNDKTGQLLESLDGARSFALRTTPVTTKFGKSLIAPMPGKAGELWLSVGGMVFHSADSGVTFVPLEGVTDVWTLGYGMPAPGKSVPTVFLNGSVQKVEATLRSGDDGATWVRIDDPEHQFGWKNGITGDPRVFGRLYMATGGRGIVYGEPGS
jgi:photosystem II stability/assembly factor-like uncharacterized protein